MEKTNMFKLGVKEMVLKILLMFVVFPFCLSTDTINVNESITDRNVIVSRNGSFALGFFRPGNSSHKYLGIWYNELPEKTVVWVANRENPIPGSLSGFLSINPDGNLVLQINNSVDEQLPLWSTNVSSEARTESCCAAQLLDSGNLVLIKNGSRNIVWQSFDYPTDTVLPGMKLGIDRRVGLDRFLTSWKSKDDPATGDWLYKLDPTGCPQLFLRYKDLTRYWRSSPWPWNYELVPGSLVISVYNQDEIYHSFLLDGDDRFALSRVVVNTSGLLQLFTWDRSSFQWRESRSMPRYKYGHCGANSLVTNNNIDNFECICLPGYQPKSLQQWNLRYGSAGCIRKIPETSMCRNGEGFVKVRKVKLPDTSIAALLNRNLSGSECEPVCLRNCSCKAFASLDIDGKGVGCLSWYGELMDTNTMEHSEGRDVYIRVDAAELAAYAEKKKGFLAKKGMLAIPIVSAAFILLITVLFGIAWLRKKKQKETRQTTDLTTFDLRTISAVTNNFNPANKLGQGGFGSVYKGKLDDGQEIAVKRLSHSSGQGISEFKTEAALIAKLQHRNLVKLIGSCIEGEERMLIYEYLPNKSLDCFLFDHTRRLILDWTKRFEIIVGIARGIMYLHHDSRLRIIHRDLKTSNVLLDADMNPKISDFGMARIFKGEEQVQDKTNRVVGTYGYMPPEYVIFGLFSVKSDVFSFGVIVLEIISGKKSNSCYSNDVSLNLIGHVWELWKQDRVLEIVDSSLKLKGCDDVIMRCIQIGLLCVQENAKDRPNMPSVVLMLNGETTLPSPQQPAFCLGSNKNVSTVPQALLGGETSCSMNEVTITNVEAR
ncbi:G-type lectin S-receptor-like serine/threonine-protein kinase RKS1 isoform X2 [Mercurialis annua]|uniref:G-type lectin S-receptor-like serine/threonine-protein kinase RKS1 isoform X2 n=1 Tax=Mercurialis annua TaxID=3986 RepID=UPI00215E89E3|nr:G-type lectin S-receptor-like serine/threonine-protein kinase RKS1 isoform X2 [Mercurialis annua]